MSVLRFKSAFYSSHVSSTVYMWVLWFKSAFHSLHVSSTVYTWVLSFESEFYGLHVISAVYTQAIAKKHIWVETDCKKIERRIEFVLQISFYMHISNLTTLKKALQNVSPLLYICDIILWISFGNMLHIGGPIRLRTRNIFAPPRGNFRDKVFLKA